MTSFGKLWFLALVLCAGPVFAAQGPVVEGQLLKPDGTPLEDANVQFRIQVRSPAPSNCLMYEETKLLSMVGSGGNFQLKLNDGSSPRSDAGLYSFERIFANRGTLNFAAPDCGGANSYAPNSSDTRNIVVSFNAPSTGSWEQLPIMNFGAVPYATQAAEVGGFNAESLLRVESSPGVLGSTPPLTATQYTAFSALLSGTSTAFERIGYLKGAVIPSLATGDVLVWNSGTWMAQDRLSGVQTFAKTSLPTCSAGYFLTGDGTNLNCTALPVNLPTGGSASTPSYAFSSSSGTGLFSPSLNTVALAVGGSQALTLSPGGNLGLGISSPGNKLHLYDGNPSAQLQIQLQRDSMSSYIGLEASNRFSMRTAEPIPIAFGTNGVQRMLIDSDGRVGIGTAAPQGGLHVANGAIVNSTAISNAGSVVDFSLANVQYVNSACNGSTITLNNMKSGTVYKLAILSAGTGTACSFVAYSGSYTGSYAVLSTSLVQNAGAYATVTFTPVSNKVFAEMTQFN